MLLRKNKNERRILGAMALCLMAVSAPSAQTALAATTSVQTGTAVHVTQPQGKIKELKLTRALKRGMSGKDVKDLQAFLAQFSDIYPEASVSGYFGVLTESAVKRFQEWQRIVSSGTPQTTGYGRVGVKTLSKLNNFVWQSNTGEVLGASTIATSSSQTPVSNTQSTTTVLLKTVATTTPQTPTPVIPVVSYSGGGGGGGGSPPPPAPAPVPPPAPPAPAVDTVAPSIFVVSPFASSTVFGIVELTASSSDDVGVTGVTYVLDGVNSGVELTSSPYILYLNSGFFANGDHTLQAVAHDAAGNYATSTSISFTIENAEFKLTKTTTYANQTITVPQTAMKIGEYQIADDATDAFTFGTIELDLSQSSISPSLLQDVYLVIGTETTPIHAIGSNQLFWYGDPTDILATSTTLTVVVYATLPASLASGGTITSSLFISGFSHNTGIVVYSDIVQGQRINIGAGTLTVAVDASSPVSAQVVANTLPKVGSFKFVALNDNFTLNELSVSVPSDRDATAITDLVFKSGSTVLGTQTLTGRYATITNLSLALPYNSTKVIDVYEDIGAIGGGAGNSGANVGLTLVGYQAMSGSGATTTATTSLSGNSTYAYASKPTISSVALLSTVLTDGTKTITKFSVTADALGTIHWDKMVFNIATTSATVTNPLLYDALDQSTPLGICSLLNRATQISCVGVDKEVSGSKTYVLNATIDGAVSGASVSTNIGTISSYSAPTTAADVEATDASFVWSDESASGHSLVTTDWNNDFLVKNLPLSQLIMAN